MTYACCRCRRAGFAAHQMFDSGQSRTDGTPIFSWCKGCREDYVVAREAAIKADPVKLAKRRQANRTAKARRAKVKRDHVRALEKEARRRRMADPAYRAEVARKARERRARLKAEDPEAFERLLARERETRRKRLAKPAARQRHSEARRIWSALRREERGVLGTGTPRGVIPDEAMGILPVAPLLAKIEGWRGDEPERTVQALGIDEKNLRDWRGGLRTSVQFDVADRVLTHLEILWWEVWEEGEPGYERAAELFTGEKVAA